MLYLPLHPNGIICLFQSCSHMGMQVRDSMGQLASRMAGMPSRALHILPAAGARLQIQVAMKRTDHQMWI